MTILHLIAFGLFIVLERVESHDLPLPSLSRNVSTELCYSSTPTLFTGSSGRWTSTSAHENPMKYVQIVNQIENDSLPKGRVEVGGTSPRDCLGTCHPANLSHHRDSCETELCTEDVKIKSIYREGMFCTLAGVAPATLSIGCVIKRDRSGVWCLTVRGKDSACKAICFSLYTLLAKPHYTPEFFHYTNYNSGDWRDIETSNNLVGYCFLQGISVSLTRETKKFTSGCRLDYTNKKWRIKIDASPATKVHTNCSVTCLKDYGNGKQVDGIYITDDQGVIGHHPNKAFCSMTGLVAMRSASRHRHVKTVLGGGCLVSEDSSAQFWQEKIPTTSKVQWMCAAQCGCEEEESCIPFR